MTFDHNGTKIDLSSDGTFLAKVAGKNVRKPSLKAMKEFIDTEAKIAFKPFDVLTSLEWWSKDKAIQGTDLQRVKITALGKSLRRRSKGEPLFEAGSQTIYHAYQDCQQAVEAAKAIKKHNDESKRIDEKRSEEREALEAVLEKFKLDPKNFTEKQA